MSTPAKDADYWRERARQYGTDGKPDWRKLYLYDEEYNAAIHEQHLEACREIGRKARRAFDEVFRRAMAGDDAEAGPEIPLTTPNIPQ